MILRRARKTEARAGEYGSETVERDADILDVEHQRANRVGPDYDPCYFDKLNAAIAKQYGSVVSYKPFDD